MEDTRIDDDRIIDREPCARCARMPREWGDDLCEACASERDAGEWIEGTGLFGYSPLTLRSRNRGKDDAIPTGRGLANANPNDD